MSGQGGAVSRWIDTHCHLDAPSFAHDVEAERALAAAQGVDCCVIPAVQAADFDAVRLLAHRLGDAYALGIHPLYVAQAQEDALQQLDWALQRHGNDARLVAVGEIGLDYFVPELAVPGPLRERQEFFYRAQLKMARRHRLPVILHVRRSVDAVLKGLRSLPVAGGIAHAFNGSLQQAQAFMELGFKLGFGGAVTYERALQLRRLAVELPLSALVLETDAPDIPPHWLYRTATERALGVSQGRNSPVELSRIGAVLANLRGMPMAELAAATRANSLNALPRLAELLAPG